MKHYYRFFMLLSLFFFFNENTAFSQTLQEYIDIAIQNNAQLNVRRYDVLLATEKANEVSTFESSEFGFGIPVFPRTTYWGVELFSIEAKQKFPWFGELKVRKELEEQRSTLKENDLLFSEKRLIYQVKEQFYTLYEQSASRELVKETKELLSRYEDMAMAALENNLSSLNEVLKITIKKNELHSKSFQLYNQIEATTNNFNRLLEQDENTILNISNHLDVLDILVSNNKIEDHPLLQNLHQQQVIYRYEEILVDKAVKPRITVGVEYISVNKDLNSSNTNYGKDILIPQVGVEIPIGHAKYTSQKQQLKLQQEQLIYIISEQRKQLNISIENENLNYNNAMVQVVAAQNNTVETQRVIDLYIKNAETQALQYMKIIELELQKLDYQLVEIEATKNAFIANARLEYLSE